MRKVFAVVLFLLLLTNCMKSSIDFKNIVTINSTFKSSAIYSATGDFDGDHRMESMFITKPDENYYISILGKDSILYKKLDYQVKEFKLMIQDVNDDLKEDIILNVVQNGSDNCYVYAVDTELITLLSPDIIKTNLDLEKINNYIAMECGGNYLSLKNNNGPDIKLYYTEMDYAEDENVFISEGAVIDKNISILTIQATVSIDEKGIIKIKDMNMHSVNN